MESLQPMKTYASYGNICLASLTCGLACRVRPDDHRQMASG